MRKGSKKELNLTRDFASEIDKKVDVILAKKEFTNGVQLSLIYS
jgi:hypothetical protein